MTGEADTATVKERAKETLRRAMGSLMIDALADPKTVELILNADGKLWQERLGEKMTCIGTIAPNRAETIVKAVAGYHGKEATRLQPTLRRRVPDRWLALRRANAPDRAGSYLRDPQTCRRDLHSRSVRHGRHYVG